MRIVLGFLPILMTAGAAMLAYALAVYPIREQVSRARKDETLGGLIGPTDARSSILRVYYEDSGVDVKRLDDVLWAGRTVLTPYVGYGEAPGHQHNAYIDSHQFRGHKKLTTPKPANVTRIFLTGASTAFGSGASSDDRTIGAYLQGLFDRREAPSGHHYEVFTFATPAWSSTQERIAIENRISELEPDLVIELTGVADCFYGQLGRNVLWARGFHDQHYWQLMNSAFARAGFKRMTDVQDASSQPVPPGTVGARLKKNVQLAAYALSLQNARLHVFLQPVLPVTTKALSPREATMGTRLASGLDPDYFRECYRQIAEGFGVGIPANAAFTNLSSVFDSVPETEEIFLDNAHFGDRGNLAIAVAIAEAVR